VDFGYIFNKITILIIKNMNSKLIVLLNVVVLLFFSCKQQPKVSQYNSVSEKIILGMENLIRYDSLVDKIEHIKLEDNENCLIGQISQILFTDSLLIIVDKESANSINVFDMSGKFKCKIGSVGQGPAEYISPWHVTLHPNKKQIVVEDITQHKILYFSYTGEFEYSERTPFMLNYYEYLANGYKAFDVSHMKDPTMGELVENTLIVTNDKNNIVYGACTDFYSDQFSYAMNKSLRRFDDKVYYSPNFSNEIYEINDTSAILKYTLSIPENGMPPLNKNTTDGIFNDYCQKYNLFYGDYIELQDFTFFNLMTPKGYPLIIYSHAQKKSYHLLFYHLLFTNEAPKARYKDNWLVFDRNAFDLMERKKYLYELNKEVSQFTNILDEIYEGLTEDSNPVIFLYHFNPDQLK
jgi:hypothetical protein